jgi:pSer/pThr/pTyr-binding forkhead associated (FHA) protein
MPWRCPVCGTENRDDALTCRVCGAYKPEATTRRVAQIAKESVSATLLVEVLESPVESLVGRRFEIKVTTPGAVISVGRAVENQVIVPDPAVSRRHLRLIVTSNGVVVEDLGSSNGTYLMEGGGERLVKAENVGRQAVVRVGGTKLRIALLPS